MRSLAFSFLLAAFLVAGPASSAAQGFNAFSGRNHPELRWQAAETEHFEIMYPQRLAGIEAEAAPLAEAAYAALSANLNVTFDEKIRIYLSDEDEIVNGFAVPIGAGYTNIWVHVNDAADVFTGREKWLRKVLAHELAHIFHYRAVRSNLGFFGLVLADALPSFWTEGLAQYQTETWDAQRGDRWLRTAILEDDLSYTDGRSVWNGRLKYAVGNAQVRYFAEQYGDSTLARLLAHRDTLLFGLARVHDFESAFEDVAGKTHRAFYDDWRRHLNVYYNTLAGQLPAPDSLELEDLDVPGRYVYDVRFSPDTARVAVVSLLSPRRPVRRLYVLDPSSGDVETVAEGPIRAPVSWSPDGQRIAFARLSRGRKGSLLNDLFVVDADGKNLRRLTRSRRTSSPAFDPQDGQRLAFIGSEDGTANVFLLDLKTGRETPLTRFAGDVQLSGLAWSPTGGQLAFARFNADGTRGLVLLDPAETEPLALRNGAMPSATLTAITSGSHDDRYPVWRPDGKQIAYTSLRDDVPNVFVYDLAEKTHRRVTHLVSGATAHGWLPPDSAFAEGRLVITTTVSKARDAAHLLDAAHRAAPAEASVPAGFATWTTHRPPQEVAERVPPDASLITARYPYRSWANITHVASLAVPYYLGPDDAGIAGFTAWTEPLGKHAIAAGGAFSLTAPASNSAFFGAYVNNQLYPTLAFSAYRLPGSARAYGDDLLVEGFLGGDVEALWPLDWRARPYASTRLGVRLRYVDVEPERPEDIDLEGSPLLRPEAGQQADLRLALTRTKLRPYRDNPVHPLDGYGLRAQVTGAAPLLGADFSFVRGDVAAYTVRPGFFGLQRLFFYARAQAQTGDPLPQDYLGFSRYDHVQIGAAGLLPISLGDTERVRGYRSYAVGTRALFGSVEYRVPLLSDLQTEILGLARLGTTTLAAFADGGLVWTGADVAGGVQRAGVGLEVKNALVLFGGGLRLAHAVGVAQPAERLGSATDYEVYYRLRTALPF